ncbi:MAG: CHAT domain-containing protein, partial [Gammaproteobacteria bacterium]
IHAANGSDVDQAQTLARRAETRLKRGDVAGALTDSVTALEMFEGIGVQSLQAETRAAFRASYRDTVELRIAALLAQADAVRADDAAQAESLLRAAFAASDRSRAQLLAESAGPSGTVVSGELLAERQRTYELLIAKRQQRDRLLDTADPNQERAENLAREIELLRAQARLIEGRIASREPVFAARGARTPETVFDAVPPGTLVAEYFLGHKQSWLFEVRDEGIRVHVLGPSDDIDRLARELHLSWRRAAHDGSDRLAPARRLSRLLYGPLGYAASAGGIWIVPDGALHLVPMALLAAQTWSGFAPGAAVVIPSLSSLARATQTDPAPPYRLAVIADPVYSADDPRIREVARKAAVAGTSRPVTANSAGDELRRLPSTAIEARDLVALVDDPAQTLALLGPNASRESVSQAPLDRYQFVHFAAHARADSRDPALAMLALSNWSADGEPIVGTLRVYDITRLRLNADLVVLSACDTALGRVIAGEGPIGLSHAFLRSGARAVLATLWQVPDTSTAVLMREFYRQMLENGRPPPVALAVAQAQLRGQTRWQDPYFWAGFQLVTNARLDALNNKDVAGREES